MKLRHALLASTILPLAMGYPAFALERTSVPLVLAQADQPVCPEGEACPPVEEQVAPQEPAPAVEEPAPPPEPAPAVEEPAPEPAPVMEETPPPEPAPAVEEPAPPEPAPAVEEPAPEPAPVMEEPPPPEPAPAVEEPAPEPAPAMEEPAPEPAPAVEEPAPQEPAPAAQEPAPDAPAAQEPPPAIEPAPDQAVAPAVEEDSTVEQQLDAQGDQEEARSVRTLRDRLLQQLQGAGVLPDEDGQAAPQADGDRPRNRDRRRGDGNRGDGWWDNEQDDDVVERRGGRIVIDLGNGNLSVEPVAPDEGGRLLYGADDVEVQNLPRGMTRTIVHRRNGVDIVTVRDRYGDIVKRSKIFPDGTEIVLIDNRFPDDYQGERPQRLRDLPPLVIGIPEDRYIVDYGDASDDDIRTALIAPPVQQMERPYRLDEVLQNQEVRAYSPRIDLDSITFETGSATIGNDQMRSLYQLGEAMEEVIADSPDELYLIEGHTDAVGRAGANLILSDQRAEAVATALSQNFDIPPENLVTQGYGEEFLKVNTDEPERRNRRAAVRRLTDLLQAQNQ